MFDNLTTLFNNEDLIKHLRDSVFLISFGINDYGFNYLRPTYNGSLAKLEPEVFAKYVLNELSFRLTVRGSTASFCESFCQEKVAENECVPTERNDGCIFLGRFCTGWEVENSW